MSYLLKSLLICSFLIPAAFAQYFQVISSNPQDWKYIHQNYKTFYQKNRIWIVEESKVKADLRLLRPITLSEVKFIPSSQVRKATVHPRIRQLSNEVDLNRIKEHMERLLSVESRSMGAEGNKWTQDYIKNEFEALGFPAEKKCYRSYYGSEYCNIIAHKTGVQKDAKTIMIMGHFDTVGRPYAGADDNTSGTIGVLELATILAQIPTKHNIEFIAFDAEERGLYGSKAYAKELETQGLLQNYRLALNMDMIAFNKSDIISIETDAAYEADAQRLASLIQSLTTYKSEINTPAWGSDHASFTKKGISAHLTIEDWDNHNPCYHQSCDTIDKLDWNFFESIIRVNLAMVLETDLKN